MYMPANLVISPVSVPRYSRNFSKYNQIRKKIEESLERIWDSLLLHPAFEFHQVLIVLKFHMTQAIMMYSFSWIEKQYNLHRYIHLYISKVQKRARRGSKVRLRGYLGKYRVLLTTNLWKMFPKSLNDHSYLVVITFLPVSA